MQFPHGDMLIQSVLSPASENNSIELGDVLHTRSFLALTVLRAFRGGTTTYFGMPHLHAPHKICIVFYYFDMLSSVYKLLRCFYKAYHGTYCPLRRRRQHGVRGAPSANTILFLLSENDKQECSHWHACTLKNTSSMFLCA